MSTPALQLPEDLRIQGKRERLTWGPVALRVTDIAQAVDFRQEALGLTERRRHPDGTVELGTSRRSLVILHPGACRPVQPGHAGMYHVAIGVPSQSEFSRFLVRLAERRFHIAPVDHTMSKAIYLNDPDGHGIEIVYETPERFARFVKKSRGIGMIDSNGRLRSGRDALDMVEELSFASLSDLGQPISDDDFIAHLHLHVPALPPAIRFFEQFGFVSNSYLPEMGMADLGAGSAYTHRIAVNIWQGPGVVRAPADSARLLGYTLHARDRSVIAEARSRLGLTVDGDYVLANDVTGADVRLALPVDNTEREEVA